LDEQEYDAEEGGERISRSERKRRAEALQKLGVRLTALRQAQLQRLQLPQDLLDAVLEAQRLHSRAAIARQRQFIGRLMRGLDPEPIERALAQVVNGRDAKMPR
jgi:ribosome-associated protein